MKIHVVALVSALFAFAAHAQNSTSLVFEAKDAKVAGGGKAKFESGPDQQNIGIWESTNTAVSWTCPSLPKGTYRVFAVYSCTGLEAGSEFEVTVGNQRASFTVPATGGWLNYKEADLGPVIIRKPAAVEITCRVTRIARQYGINLRSIKLVPEL